VLRSNQGFIKLQIIISIALGLGFGASAFLNYQQHQRAEQDKKLLQGEITDLRYQREQDQKASTSPSPSASPSASPSPDTSPTPTPSSTPAVAGDSTSQKTGVMKAAANVRKEPSSNAEKVFPSMLPKGTTVAIGTDARNGYQQITVNGKTGYVLASYLQF